MFNPLETNESDERLMIEEVYRLAKETSEADAIKMENFADLYGRENVQKDIAYVQKMEGIFEAEPAETKKLRQMALIFEAVINEQIELSDWLGPDAHTIKSSPYDDIRNGIDNIVEFR